MPRFLTFAACASALALCACGAPERPALLTSALYHGFTLVDSQSGEVTASAWAVVAGGQVTRQGVGAPPSGDFIAEIDLSGALAMSDELGEIAFLSGDPLRPSAQTAHADRVTTGGAESVAHSMRADTEARGHFLPNP